MLCTFEEKKWINEDEKFNFYEFHKDKDLTLLNYFSNFIFFKENVELVVSKIDIILIHIK